MGFADVWNRTLVYFGIAEEDDWDEDGYATNEDLERSYGARERANVRRLQPRRGRDFDDWTDSEPEAAATTAVARPPSRLRGVESVPNPASVKVHQDLSKRLIDFASGLTYALDGGMQRVADKVFLLTPRNVEVSAEERARMLERGGFFNQA